MSTVLQDTIREHNGEGKFEVGHVPYSHQFKFTVWFGTFPFGSSEWFDTAKEAFESGIIWMQEHGITAI